MQGVFLQGTSEQREDLPCKNERRASSPEETKGNGGTKRPTRPRSTAPPCERSNEGGGSRPSQTERVFNARSTRGGRGRRGERARANGRRERAGRRQTRGEKGGERQRRTSGAKAPARPRGRPRTTSPPKARAREPRRPTAPSQTRPCVLQAKQGRRILLGCKVQGRVFYEVTLCYAEPETKWRIPHNATSPSTKAAVAARVRRSPVSCMPSKTVGIVWHTRHRAESQTERSKARSQPKRSAGCLLALRSGVIKFAIHR